MTAALRYLMDAKRHLVCVPYSVPNLHVMAADLGIKRCWFHAGDKPHYDVPKKLIATISTRCEIVTPRRILEVIKNGR